MEKRTTFGGFRNIEDEIAYNNAVMANIKPQNREIKKARNFDRFAHNNKGCVDLDAIEVIACYTIIGILSVAVVGLPVLWSLEAAAEAHTKKLNEFIDTQSMKIKLENGNVLSVDKVVFTDEDGKHRMTAYCTETSETAALERIVVCDFEKEQYDRLVKIQEDYNNAIKSANITKKTLNKNKDFVKTYYDEVKKVVAEVAENDQVSVYDVNIPSFEKNV